MRGGADESLTTRGQSLTTSTEWLRSPSASGTFGWNLRATAVGAKGDVYIAGDLASGSQLDFVCARGVSYLDNPADSYVDAFLAKLDHEGNCVWQMSLGDNLTRKGERTGYLATDLAVYLEPTTGAEHVILAGQNRYEPLDYTDPSKKATGSYVREFNEDAQGNPQSVWTYVMGGVESYHKEIEAIDIDDDGYLTAVGRHNVDFSFAGVNSPNPSSLGHEFDAFILNWGPYAPHAPRAERWQHSFGGGGSQTYLSDNSAVDVAVEPVSGDIAVVGNFRGEHQDLDANTVNRNIPSIFIQTLDRDGLHVEARTTEPQSSPNSGERKYASAAAFADSGTLYVTGSFDGDLAPYNAGISPAYGSGPISSNDLDWFVVGYTDGVNLFGQKDWDHSDLDHDDRALDITTGTSSFLGPQVAITGRGCLSSECAGTSFALVFSEGSISQPSSLSGYQWNGDAYSGTSIHLTDTGLSDPYAGSEIRLHIGGMIRNTTSEDFIESYLLDYIY